MSVENVVGPLVAVVLIAYLVAAVIFPKRF
ncbi:F subunit of K+-transporting ATPase [Kribbella orskensis]|uniref:F subunit of K+-transporting ATPase n=1 Tax=Kribbella orskensis TaxID=2512216 RepID=A0ABY2B9U1_9ACTN|nr:MULTISPECIES: potassium-transporting ATPase subunit F [Kribbella]TCN32722.1 F subunit of K+-transporting ATPase [Kribbella sp. VKM Ac-2500]TCO12961.1 F subunit of K+-transporting ATPase [Kribbella orskensis]